MNKSYRKNHKISANDISYKKNQQNFKIPNVLTTANKKQEEDNKNSNKELLTEDNKIYYESEIREKIKQFKENLYREFFRHVEDEKRNENLRNKQLENVHDPRKKHELEKRFSKERALVDLRLKRENQNIEEKVKTYEINLRQNNINNHNLYFKNKNKNTIFIFINSFSPDIISFNFFISLNLVSKLPISSADFHASSNCVLNPSVFSSILGYKLFINSISLSPLLNILLNNISPIFLLFSSKKLKNLLANNFCNSNCD